MERNWARDLRRGLIDPQGFYERGWIDERVRDASLDLKGQLDFRVPRVFEDLIKSGDESIKRQFVPSHRELNFRSYEIEDPIGDEAHTKLKGLVHRYKDRVLIKPTHRCASYCRYCFRKFKVSHSENELTEAELEACLEYVKSHPEIKEVILTGGDPMTLTDSKLGTLLRSLDAIGHLRLLRIHTRVFTVLPSRLTPGFMDLLKTLRKTLWFVTHINSASEITDEARAAMRLASSSGIPLLNQSVLLKGINDNFEALSRLSLALVENRITPYYLHYPDRVRGTDHFRIPLDEAVELYRQLRGQLPGYAIPTLILDIPGGGGKIPLDSGFVTQTDPLKVKSPLAGAEA